MDHSDLMSDDHPTNDQLVAYNLGRLDPDEAAVLDAHIGQCDSCCWKLKEVPDDTLIGMLRRCDSDTDANAQSSAANECPTPLVMGHGSRYRLLGLLGSGGMGTVYRAQHLLMQRIVALKVINPKMMQRPEAIERFEREVRAAANLRHPNIVVAYDAEKEGDQHFLVMEYVDGRNLAEVVRDSGPLGLTDACNYIRQAALGLQHAHKHGMVHRDIKPHNLMLTPCGEIKILDFGLATVTSSFQNEGGIVVGDAELVQLTHVSTTIGSPDYIAPEQSRDAHTADIRADIYSLGCTLYFLLTGQPPFPQQPAVQKLVSHREREPKAITDLRRDVPPALVRVLRRMMAKVPDDRYQTPIQVAEALAPFADWHKRRDWFSNLVSRVHMFPFVLGTASLAIVALLIVVINSDLSRSQRQHESVQPSESPSTNSSTDEGKRATETKPLLTAEDIRAARRLTGGWGSSWSPDGLKLARHNERTKRVEIVDVATGIYEDLCEGGDPAWSPRFDGSIASIRVRGGGNGPREIWLAKPDGTNVRHVADGIFPGWSADGNTLYFFQVRNQSGTLSSLDIDDPAAQPMPIMPCPSAWPSVSPNAQFVSVHERAYTDQGSLVVIEIATQLEVMRHGLPSWPGMLGRWSPDSRYFSWGSFGDDRGWWMLDIKTRQVWLVAEGPFTLPSWSPDGRQIAVDDRGRQEVLIFDATQLISLASTSLAITSASSDGSLITNSNSGLLRTSPSPEPATPNAAQPRESTSTTGSTSNADATAPYAKVMGDKPLLSSDDLLRARRIKDGWSASWSPDGRRIVRRRDSTRKLEIVDLETAEQLAVGNDGDPAWSPLPGGPIACSVGDARELWLYKPDGTGGVKVADGAFLPCWNLDGRTLYFLDFNSNHLCSLVVNEDPPKIERLMRSPTPWNAVSPDGKLVAYRDPETEDLIVRAIATQRILIRHSTPSWPGVLASWSPDSRYLGFSDFGWGEGIWMLDFPTARVWKVASGALALPRWSWDGKNIVVDDRALALRAERTMGELLIFDAAQVLLPEPD